MKCPQCNSENDSDLAESGMIHCVCGHWFNERHPTAIRQANLFSCPSCAKPVSYGAINCPACGHAFRPAGAINLSDPVHIVGLIVCVIILLLVAGGIYGRVIGF